MGQLGPGKATLFFLSEGGVKGLLGKVQGRKLPKPSERQEFSVLPVGIAPTGNTIKNTAAV